MEELKVEEVRKETKEKCITRKGTNGIFTGKQGVNQIVECQSNKNN